MDSLQQLVIARLKQGFSEVEGLLALSDWSGNNLPRARLFVMELADRPGPAVEGTGLLRQEVTTTVGVLLVVPARNNLKPDLATERDSIRSLLFGWSPSAEHSPLALAGGQLQPSRHGTVAWLEKFTTEHTEDAIGV